MTDVVDSAFQSLGAMPKAFYRLCAKSLSEGVKKKEEDEIRKPFGSINIVSRKGEVYCLVDKQGFKAITKFNKKPVNIT